MLKDKIKIKKKLEEKNQKRGKKTIIPINNVM
jgi:hypothetical protein